jgi:hypothetical protein
MTEALTDFDTFKAIAETCGWLQATWTIGGTTGGNCWGGEANQSVTPDDEPDDVALDAILEKVCPSLTFLQYRKLMRAGLYEISDEYLREYYGNSTEERTRTLKLDVLYNTLKEILG